MRAVVVAVAAALISVGSGCGHFYSREDLAADLAKHHIDLRWGRLENAAMRVVPEMRGPFLQVWAQRLGAVELQDMDVAGVAMIDDDTAEVVVVVVYINKLDMSVRTVQVPERWKRTDAGWMLASVAELPTTSAPPADDVGAIR